MTISEAAKLSTAYGFGIYREAHDDIVVFPTNGSYLLCIASNRNERRHMLPGWQPKLNDLTAEDWNVAGLRLPETVDELDHAD